MLEERGQSTDSLEDGVEATVRLTVGEDVEGMTGTFFDRQEESTAQGQAYDPEALKRLWDLSEELVGPYR